MPPQKHLSSTHARLIPIVLAHFKLGTARSINPIQEAYANDNYFVQTELGVFAVKFLQEAAFTSIANDIAISDQIKRAGIATPTYKTDDSGAALFSIQGHNIVVSEKILGTIPQNRNHHLNSEIGRVLATFHTHVKTLPKKRMAWLNPQLNRGAAEGLEIFEKDLPQGIIHGDLHSENIHVDSEELNNIVAIFDFECSEENLFIVDIARSILSVCHTNAQEIDQAHFDSLVSGYETVRKLQKEEYEHLPHAVAYASQACIAWFLEKGYGAFAKKFAKRADSFSKIRVSKRNLTR